MVSLKLKIVSPTDTQVFVYGTPDAKVVCRGKLESTPPPFPLYFRWYSSLNPLARQDHYSLNETALTAAETGFEFLPEIGSHVITFAASDQKGEQILNLKAITSGGVTGGAHGASPCRIHICKARIVDLPVLVGAVALELAAEAPWDWKGIGYQQNDMLRYRWVFEPSGAPAGRPSISFAPARDKLSFRTGQAPARVAFKPTLPAAARGEYKVTLFVETPTIRGATTGAQDSRLITLL